MTVLVLIPARGGSKRLPGKNLRTVGGVSLVGHAVRCAESWRKDYGPSRALTMCDTDSEEIAVEAKRYGATVPFLREPEYAQDDTTSEMSTIRFLDRLSESMTIPDTVVLLQPTSPLRDARDVEEAWKRFQVIEHQAVTTVSIGDSARANGAVYIVTARWLLQGNGFASETDPKCRSYMSTARSIDINTAEDLAEAERLWSLQHG